MIPKPLPALAGLALAFTPLVAAPGDYTPTGPVRPSAGLLNDYLRQNDAGMAAWDIGASTRLRYEVRDNFGIAGKPGSSDFRATGADTDNAYLLYRLRPRVGYNSEWFSALVEGRHSGETGDERRPSPEADDFDLHQAYFSIGNHKEFPISAKIGRQEMIYGDERLIGAFAWNNIGRVFDAAKVRWQNPWFGVDLFTSRPVVPADHQFNMSNDNEYFSGAYFNTKKIPHQTTEAYFLARNVATSALKYTGVTQLPSSPRDVYTVGLRVKSNPGEFNGWDYGAEAMGQFGSFVDLGRRQDHEAYAFFAGGGYTFTETTATPRLGLEYNYGSGDSDSTDGTHGTFDNLYPTNHKFYGFMDFASLQNLHNVRLSASAKPLPRLTFTADYHSFWLADTRDVFYNAGGGKRAAGGYGIKPANDSHVGSEIDLIMTYAISPVAVLETGFGHFFTGKYVDQSLAASGAKDANWVYVSLNLNF